ncbi:L-histidine N(alpha)-methyltransferase [Chitinophaga japonensis]|uniref:Dimethylhistidine N-methyltransferase n=1 Tax=Chitinophaga japonensis TaxID=104662 RepID=A0A562SYX4_CHIJA|nr:L-histidine N(alpha)-methyltransferase [Chitinophaga japonensis]TWI86525.1 dimethylhistidine N-methyltransferase [Chitinophaga japonensis]
MNTTSVPHPLSAQGGPETQRASFYRDVVRGLTATPKYLESKYFYDAAGDRLFQQIMQCPEYYLTDCEMEIMQEQAAQIAAAITVQPAAFDLVELGPGDATKSIHLLRRLQESGADFTYYPIDISANVIAQLKKGLPEKLPGLSMQGLNGDYFDMLQQLAARSRRPKVLLFMGANIGNFTPAAAAGICRRLYACLQPGDLLLAGFDLKKHPRIILNAYNDAAGFTREFNLNLLHRINRELQGDFDLLQFEHYPVYDPGSGACKSYLVSRREQEVHIGREVTIHFGQYEPMFMEISQKYSLPETEQLAQETGFTPLTHFTDRRKWFADCLWRK